MTCKHCCVCAGHDTTAQCGEREELPAGYTGVRGHLGSAIKNVTGYVGSDIINVTSIASSACVLFSS